MRGFRVLGNDKEHYAELLNSCSNVRDLVRGKQIHSRILHSGLGKSLAVLLLQMYGKCKSPHDARHVFDSIEEPSPECCTNMIIAYTRSGCFSEALELYRSMRVSPSAYAYPTVLSACAALGDLEQGRQIHARITRENLDRDLVIATSLVGMYTKCGNLDTAESVFESMLERNPVTWAAMITGYVRNERYHDTIQCFRRMNLDGTQPDAYVCSGVLIACSKHREFVSDGKLLHRRILEDPRLRNVVVETSLLIMYANFGSLEEAEYMFHNMSFRDSLAWTRMIEVYLRHNRGRDALLVFKRMLLDGVEPETETFRVLLAAFRIDPRPHILPYVKLLHSWIDEIISSSCEVSNALIDVYSSCGSIVDAKVVFERLELKNTESWNVMILALANSGLGREALSLFERMVESNQPPDTVTFNRILGVCADLGALPEGRAIHSRMGNVPDGPVGNSLVNMYAKCGSLRGAREVFDAMEQRNVVGWTAMIVAYAQHGLFGECLDKFRLMSVEGIDPDSVTFTGLLNACSHAGLVAQGWSYFASMIADHGIGPTVEQYETVVDLLGRSGRLDAAEELIEVMPFQPDEEAWFALLSATRVHGDVERGGRLATHALQTSHTPISSPYVLLSNMYTL